MRATEIRDRLLEIEEDSFEEKCLSKDLRNLIFEIKYKE